MNIETLPSGARLVRRYRKGRCYAAVWSADTTDKQVESQMSQGDAAFFPYNETTGEFLWSQGNGRPSHFKR